MKHCIVYSITKWVWPLVILFLNPGYVIAEENPEELFSAARQCVTSDPDRAIEIARKLITGFTGDRDDQPMARGYYIYGVAFLHKGKYLLSADYFKRAISTEYAGDNLSFQEACWNNLGIALDYQKKPEEAIEAYNRSLSIVNQMKDSLSIMQTLLNIAILDRKAGNPVRAKEKFNQALRYFISAGDSIHTGLTYQNLGMLYNDKKEYRLSDNFYEQALTFFNPERHPKIYIDIGINLAQNALAYNDTEKSQNYLKRAIEWNKKIDNQLNEAQIGILLGDIEFNKSQFSQAEEHYRNSLNLYQINKSDEYSGEVMLKLMKLYARTGDYNSYIEMMNAWQTVTDNHADLTRINLYNELAELYEHEKHIKMIEDQKQELTKNARQLVLLAAGLGISILISIIIFVMYLKIKWYKKFIFREKVTQLKATENDLAITSSLVKDLSNGEGDRYLILFKRIVELMDSKKMYTQNDLTLNSLAVELNTNEKYISTAINRHSGTNFPGFLNGYRINEACRMLMNGGKKYKMADIAKHSGYNDPSTFYRKFKETTGLTPKQFIEMKSDLPEAMQQ